MRTGFTSPNIQLFPSPHFYRLNRGGGEVSAPTVPGQVGIQGEQAGTKDVLASESGNAILDEQP